MMPPIILPFLISLTCGQDVIIPSNISLARVGILSITCQPFNGSEPLYQKVFKDGVLIGSFRQSSLGIFQPDDDDFGTYTFVLSTKECGHTFRVSRIRQG